MALQIIIGSTDVTTYTRAGSIRIKRAADGGIGTADFTLLEPVGILDYARVDYANTDEAILAEAMLPAVVEAFAPVEIKDGGQPIFKGKIAQVRKALGGSHLSVSVSCQDVVADLARVLIYQYSVNNTTAGAIVAWVISQCAGVLTNDASFVVDNTSISTYEITGKSALEVLRDLAGQVKATWFVDLAGRLHWRPRTNPEASGKTYGLIAGDGILAGTLSIDNDGAGLANSVTVLAQRGSTTPGNATLTGTASGDDATVVSHPTTAWPPTQGLTLSNTSPFTIAYSRSYDTSTTTHSPSSSGYHLAYIGSSWPPPLHSSAVYQDLIKSYGGGLYFISGGYYIFDLSSIPAGATITSAEIIYDLNVVNNDPYEPNSLYIERADQYSVYTPTQDAQGDYVSIPGASGSGSVMLPSSWITPNGMLYLRVGWLGMYQPVGNQNATFSSITLALNWIHPTPKHQTTKGWIKFPNPNIPANATVQSAILRLRINQKSGTPEFIVRKSNVNWPIAVGSYANESGDQIAYVSSVPAAGNWLEIALPPGSIEKSGENKYCLDPNISSPPPASHYVQIADYDSGGANKPQLVISWQTVVPAVEATAQDAASIAQYGLRRMMIFDNRLSQAECEAMAAKEVALRAWPAQSIRLSSLAGAGISPGQLVSVLFDEVGLAGSYVVQDISVSYDAAGNARYDMTLDRFRPDLIRYLSE